MNNSGPFPFEYTPSGQNIKIRKEQVVFNQHGVAILVSPAVNQSLDAASEMARSRVERLTSPSDDDRLRHYAVQGLYLRSLYKQRRLTDIAVHVGAQTFHAHKIVLTCRSQHFANMFRRKTRRGAFAVADVTLEGVAASAVGALLDYFYGGGLTLDCRNYADVRAAAALLGIDEVTSACDAFADALVSTDTALPLFALASAYGLDDVRRRASGIICRSFGDVIDSEAFLNLSADVLYDILVNDDLQIDSELQCFQAVLRWLDYDTEMRMPEAARLMATVRFRDLSTESMFECLDAAPFLLTLPECRELILAANWYRTCTAMKRLSKAAFVTSLLPPRRSVSSGSLDLMDQMLKETSPGVREQSTKRSRSAKPAAGAGSGKEVVIGLLGGVNPKVWDPSGTGKHFLTYDPTGNAWRSNQSLPEARNYHAVALLNNTIYIVGGIKMGERQGEGSYVPIDTVFRYSPQEARWSLIAPMRKRRMHHDCAAMFGLVYALGGQDEEGEVLSSVECYNPSTNTWAFVAPMAAPRLGISACVHQGQLWVVGGVGVTAPGDTGIPILTTVEVFNPRQNLWTSMNPLRVPRCWATLVEAEGDLYIVGGATISFLSENVIGSVADVDAHHADSDTWVYAAELKQARHRSTAVAVGARIYVFGGTCSLDNRPVQQTECYDTHARTWLANVKDIVEPAVGLKGIVFKMADKHQSLETRQA